MRRYMRIWGWDVYGGWGWTWAPIFDRRSKLFVIVPWRGRCRASKARERLVIGSVLCADLRPEHAISGLNTLKPPLDVNVAIETPVVNMRPCENYCRVVLTTLSVVRQAPFCSFRYSNVIRISLIRYATPDVTPSHRTGGSFLEGKKSDVWKFATFLSFRVLRFCALEFLGPWTSASASHKAMNATISSLRSTGLGKRLWRSDMV